jgi:hypothetical protein
MGAGAGAGACLQHFPQLPLVRSVVLDVTLQAEHGGAHPRMKPSLGRVTGDWRLETGVAGTGYWLLGSVRGGGEVWLGHLLERGLPTVTSNE